MRIRKVHHLVLAAITLCLLTVSAQAQDSGNAWFEVDQLNPGLPAPPENLDRSTPQGTIEALTEAIERRDWRRAVHLLDLSALDESEQPVRGLRIARQLGDIVDRQFWIDWGDLPDRPDAIMENASSNNPLAGKPRRSIRLEILSHDNRDIPLRLNRIKPKGSDPVWVFSRQTVANIPRLHGEFGPGWFEQSIPRSWKGDAFLSVRYWELVALPIVIAISILAFVSLRALFGWAVRQASWQSLQTAFKAARTPLALFLSAALLRWMTGSFLSFSAPITAILSPLLLAAMIVSITMAILRAIDTLLDIITERYVGEIDDDQSEGDRHLYTSIYAARRLVLVVAVVGGLGLLLSQLHLFETLGVSLLASAGAIAVIVSIAGHAVLGNILASLQIAMAKPVRIGDSIFFEGNWAYVEAIYYTFVRLRTWDDRRMIVPVQYLISTPFENWSMTDAKMTRTFDLVLDHRAVPAKLREVFYDIAKKDEDAMAEETRKVLVMNHDHNGILIRFYATARDPSAAWEMHARLREQMLDWIRENQPDWWPRERVLDANGSAMAGGAAGDPGG